MYLKFLIYMFVCVVYICTKAFGLIAFSIFVVTASWFISVYFALQRTWKPFNSILGETYEMVNHEGITFIAEQVNFISP